MADNADNKKITLVTGGAGFIGSHLIEALLREGRYRVISLDNYHTGTLENHKEGAEYRTGHTKDIARHVTERAAIVYHLGEYARVEKSFEDIETVWDYNITGTFAVLEYCRAHTTKLVYAGSSTKFGDGGLARDKSPYAWSKAINTELVRNYGEWFGLAYAITYFYNVYGPGERAGDMGTVIAIFRKRMEQGLALPVVAPGTQRRNFTHVEDIVRGLLLVGEKGSGDEYGLGADASYSIMEVAEMFGGPIEYLPERPGNRMDSTLDVRRSRQELGWLPRHKLSDYIASISTRHGA